MLIATATRPSASRTGTATLLRWASSSAVTTAWPCSRTRASSAISASTSVRVCSVAGGARGACEQGTGLVLGQVGQQHAAHGRGERGQARADVEVHPQDPLGVHTRDVHQVRPVEHARGAGLVQALRGLGEDRPEDLGDGPAGPVAVAELQHARGQREPPPVLHGVAELRERQQHAPRRGPGDPRGGRGLAHRERGGVRGERAQHRQTGRQGAHHVPARRGTCAGGVDVVGHVRQRSPLCAQRTPVRVTHTPFPARRGGPTVRP